MAKCDACGLREAKIHLSIEDDQLSLCNDCYNEYMAGELEVELEELLESFSLKDSEGVVRTFLVETRLYPIGIFMEAKENIEFGYTFAVHGELEDDQQQLLNRLIEKTKKGIKEKFIESKVFLSGQPYEALTNDHFAGRIEYDEFAEGLPLIIIDGRAYTWEEVGRLIKSYEGFQIKVKMYDQTDEID